MIETKENKKLTIFQRTKITKFRLMNTIQNKIFYLFCDHEIDDFKVTFLLTVFNIDYFRLLRLDEYRDLTLQVNNPHQKLLKFPNAIL